MKSIYLIGALKNDAILLAANILRHEGFDVFDDWFAPGKNADVHLLEYEKARGHSYKEALCGYAAKHVFEFDKSHIDRCDIGVMVMPAGKSAHLELGYMRGQGKPAFILFDEEPERFDCMYQFATDVFFNMDDLIEALQEFK
jgi:nucleoside 2-deoxyribosyltransferase